MTITGYCSLAEAKQLMGPIGDSADDALIDADILTASRKIDSWCGRRFTKDTAATARVYRSLNSGRVYVDDFWTTTGLIVKTDDGDTGTFATTVAASSYTLEPVNGIGPSGQTGWSYNVICAASSPIFPSITRYNNVQVTVPWGWADIPDEVNMACRFLTHRLFWMRLAPGGAAGIADLGITRIRSEADIALILTDFIGKNLLVG
jgi:hypothetical protein